MGEVSGIGYQTAADDIAFKSHQAAFGWQGAFSQKWRGEGWGRFPHRLRNYSVKHIIEKQSYCGAVGRIETMEDFAERRGGTDGFYIYRHGGWLKIK